MSLACLRSFDSKPNLDAAQFMFKHIFAAMLTAN